MNNENNNITTVKVYCGVGDVRRKELCVFVNLYCSCLFEYFPQVVRIIPCTAETSPGLSRVRESQCNHVAEIRIFDGIYIDCFRWAFNGRIEKSWFCNWTFDIWNIAESIAKLYSIDYIAESTLEEHINNFFSVNIIFDIILLKSYAHNSFFIIYVIDNLLFVLFIYYYYLYCIS